VSAKADVVFVIDDTTQSETITKTCDENSVCTFSDRTVLEVQKAAIRNIIDKADLIRNRFSIITVSNSENSVLQTLTDDRQLLEDALDSISSTTVLLTSDPYERLLRDAIQALSGPGSRSDAKSIALVMTAGAFLVVFQVKIRLKSRTMSACILNMSI